MTSDLITVGLSDAANDKLDELKEREIFAEKMDGYRFGVGLALAHGVIPPEFAKRVTLFNVGSLDPDQTLRRAVEALMQDQLTDTTVYRLVERLADWGVNELYAQATQGHIDFVAIFDKLSEKAT
ncbi:hypothetical protein ACFW16_10125 [Inquilinus sp. NPDC058860]|uniref:hypothetical protein n=1 Tax=Inquilinus sp. NPDC058860 TaxID=3346652 RepID=UPI003677A619